MLCRNTLKYSKYSKYSEYFEPVGGTSTIPSEAGVPPFNIDESKSEFQEILQKYYGSYTDEVTNATFNDDNYVEYLIVFSKASDLIE